MNSNKRLNILILNAHWDNRGDEAAIRAMIDSLKSELQINNIKIMLLARSVTQFPYDDIEYISEYPNSASSYLDSLVTLITLGKISLTCSGRKFIKSADEADIIVHAPGGPSIGDLYGGVTADYSYLYRLILSKIIKKKLLFFYAPSVGPFKNKILNLIRKFLFKNADGIVLREKISSKYLKEQLGLDSFVTIDSAFQNDIPNEYLDKYKNIIPLLNIIEHEKIIGITITDLKWHPLYGKSTDLAGRIYTTMSEFIEFLIGKGYIILLIPQLFGGQNDIVLLERFRKSNPERILILPENVDSYAQQAIISKLFCVVGMRYHSNIFSAKANVPFISIFYEHKMKGFMEILGLTELAVSVEELTTTKLIDKCVYLENKYSNIKDTLEKQTPQLKHKSKETTEILKRIVNSKSDF